LTCASADFIAACIFGICACQLAELTGGLGGSIGLGLFEDATFFAGAACFAGAFFFAVAMKPLFA
jgi:hypothetical protein